MANINTRSQGCVIAINSVCVVAITVTFYCAAVIIPAVHVPISLFARNRVLTLLSPVTLLPTVKQIYVSLTPVLL
jgi:hypothetical protein